MKPLSKSLFAQSLDCLLINDAAAKVEATYLLQQQWLSGVLDLSASSDVLSLINPGRPAKPVMVNPKDVPRRNLASLQGRLTLVHAIAHIEFNAINLALDAVYRFQNMPQQYYTDWCLVAAEEAKHFSLLSGYLASHGMKYGDMDAHNGLWEMAVKTDKDVMVRMALVPRVLEARGLDVTPTMIKKLQSTFRDRSALRGRF